MIIVVGCIAIVAAMYVTSSILTPILLGALFAVVFDIPRSWLIRRGMSQGRALAVTILGTLLLALIAIVFLGITFVNLSASLPEFQQQIQPRLDELGAMLEQAGIDGDQLNDAAQNDQTNPLNVITYVLGGVLGLLGSVVLVLVYAIFLLIEVSSFPDKLNIAFKPSEPAYQYINSVTTNLRNFLVAQTKVSLATGTSVAVALWILDIQFALLWGLVAFFMNFIPYIGPVLAAIPAIIVAFIQYGPSVTVLLVILAYLVINGIINYTIYPRVMSQGVDLSMFIVLAGMVFWGFVLGPIGLILSVPISAVIKISLESYPGSRWLAVMLGSGPKAQPQEAN
jgi:predicted PurR-regulated permease PerM